MSKADNSAFPFDSNKISFGGECAGLTKREHFAGLAMQSLISPDFIIQSSRPSGDYIATEALKYADALLIELEKKND